MGELRPCSFPISPTACRSVSSRPPPAPERRLRTVTCSPIRFSSPTSRPPCLSRRNAPSHIPAPWASCALLTLRTCHGLSLRFPHHVRRQQHLKWAVQRLSPLHGNQHAPEYSHPISTMSHQQGGIQMVTTELETDPPNPPDRRRSRQLRHRTESRQTIACTGRPISPAPQHHPSESLFQLRIEVSSVLKRAHHSEAHQRSPYRGNCASCLVTAGTSWRHASRGPPGTGLSENSRRPHGRTQALGMSWIRRKRRNEKGTGG